MAYADPSSDAVAQAKQAIDATGTAGVPADWDPSAEKPPVKQPSAAAVAAVAAAADRAAGITPSAKLVSEAAAASNALVANQKAQKTEYYCDPASVHEAVGVYGIALSQADAAGLLGTTTDGTAWYNGAGAAVPYPTKHVLNQELSGSSHQWATVNVSYSPTAAEKSAYQVSLVSDIDNTQPLIANADMVSGGPHLIGHPSTENIQHYVEIRGYTGSGASTQYEDSVHGASGASWYANVPAYSTISSNTMTTIVGGRGYVW